MRRRRETVAARRDVPRAIVKKTMAGIDRRRARGRGHRDVDMSTLTR
jgi:hypothetical protein